MSHVDMSPTECQKCKFGSSQPGASKCSLCSINNNAPNKKTGLCTECSANQFAFPGSLECVSRPVCSQNYDFAPIFGQCIDNKRSVKYEQRKDSICNKNNFKVATSENSQSCATCNPTSFSLKGVCTPCKDGEFSAKENQNKCDVCSAGKYAPKVQILSNFDAMPLTFETKCEAVAGLQEDFCAVFKGWIVANKAITVLPYIPEGVKLSLKTNIKISQAKGKIGIKYQGTDSETLTMKIDSQSFGTVFICQK
jgi:hypothetical protein